MSRSGRQVPGNASVRMLLTSLSMFSDGAEQWLIIL